MASFSPTSSSGRFRLGTRGSPLALAQAHMVADALVAAHGWGAGVAELVIVKTTGDMVQDRPLAEIGGKALWTKELDRALLAGEIDCAVHSMKDVETIRPAAIAIAAMLQRAAVEDRLIGADSIDALPQGARIGTSSPRRAAQLRHIRPDLNILSFRGNVATRIAKLEAGDADATLLAAAGLNRLGQHDVGVDIATDIMLPAPAQGAVGIECRTDDIAARVLLDAISDRATMACVLAERALLARLNGTCHSPVAALAQWRGEMLWLRAQLYSEDGAQTCSGTCLLTPGDDKAAHDFAARLLADAPPDIVALFGG